MSVWADPIGLQEALFGGLGLFVGWLLEHYRWRIDKGDARIAEAKKEMETAKATFVDDYLEWCNGGGYPANEQRRMEKMISGGILSLSEAAIDQALARCEFKKPGYCLEPNQKKIREIGYHTFFRTFQDLMPEKGQSNTMTMLDVMTYCWNKPEENRAQSGHMPNR